MAPVRIEPRGNEDVTLGVSTLVVILAVISAALRIYTRVFTHTGLGLDDWLILAAVVATLLTVMLLQG